MAWTSLAGFIIDQAVGTGSTVPKQPLGLEIQAVDPDWGVATFIYLGPTANANIEIGSVCSFKNETFAAGLLQNAAGAKGAVCVSVTDFAAEEYGWFMIIGRYDALTGAGCADGATLNATTTPGTVDDATISGGRIDGMVTVTTRDTVAGTNEVSLHRPYYSNEET